MFTYTVYILTFFEVVRYNVDLLIVDHRMSIFLSNYFCCPRRCAYTILEGFTVLYFLYIIAQHLTVFMDFCHENKVWYWVPFDIPPLPEIQY